MSVYTHTDKQSGDGLAIQDWNNLSSAVAGSSGLKLAVNADHKVGIGTSSPRWKLEVVGETRTRGLRFDSQTTSHISADGALYRCRGEAFLAVDNNLYVRDVTTGNKFHFNTDSGRLAVGGESPAAPLSISGGGKESHPDGAMHITQDSILFGGRNSGREASSASITAGKHTPNSLCIVGMSADTGAASRKIDIWAEGGLTVRGTVHATKFVGDGSGLTNLGSAGLSLATSSGNVGIGTTAPAAKLDVAGVTRSSSLDISGDGKQHSPDGSMHITHDTILFGGRNSGKQRDSAQISAGLHMANSLCIVGMASSTSASTRRIDMWAEGGLTVRGSLKVNTRYAVVGSKSAHTTILSGRVRPNQTPEYEGDSGLVVTRVSAGRFRITWPSAGFKSTPLVHLTPSSIECSSTGGQTWHGDHWMSVAKLHTWDGDHAIVQTTDMGSTARDLIFNIMVVG